MISPGYFCFSGTEVAMCAEFTVGQLHLEFDETSMVQMLLQMLMCGETVRHAATRPMMVIKC